MKKYLSLVTFTHTIFAMPFAFIGFFFGGDHQWVPLWLAEIVDDGFLYGFRQELGDGL